ncbi:hypothetical protein KC946_01780 [Candidatus Saccharibacteria bacterium]|nr:hypothetical protein [Candidatus Saccharibacteria bacterium]
MQNYPNFRINKKYLFLGITLFLIGIGFWMYSRLSYIEVSLKSSPGNSDITYNLYENNELKDTSTSKETSYKKLVTRGDYEVITEAGDKTSINIASTGGFLKTTKVTAELKPKKHIEFIGDNPRPCMLLTKVGLISYGCGDQLVSTYYHVPANPSTPTYTKKIESIYDGTVEGTFTLNGKDFIAVQGPDLTDGNEQPPQAAYELVGNIETGKAHVLRGLDDKTTYSITPYRSGVLAINSELNKAFYFSDVDSQPTDVDIFHPENGKSNYPYDISVSKEGIIIGFSQEEQSDISKEDLEKTPTLDTTIVTIIDGNKRVFDFNKLYDDIKLCGDNTICLLADSQINIYDISKDEPALLGKISGVNSFETNGSAITANRETDVISFNTKSMSGSVDYTFGAFQPCGLQPTQGSNYILCVTNSGGESAAVEVTDGPISPVDSYVSKLYDIPEVEKVSPYGNIIFISPDLGDYQYNSATNSFEYDPEIKSSVNSKIRETISNFNADPKYKFINPLDN